MNSGTKVIGAVVALGVIIAASVWLGRQNPSKPTEVISRTENPTTLPKVTPGSNAAIVPRPPTTTKPVLAATNSEATTAAAGTNNLITDWNEKIDEALKSGGEDRDVAKSLLKMFPRFPAEGQVEAIQHISNLLPDEDYPELAKLMEDAKLPEDVLDQLIMDLLNRPNKIMLPELVQVAKNSQHPKASEAKDFLELYLEEDYGADWNLWKTKVDEWLKANPE